MASMYDLLATALFVAAAAMFFLRYRHERPPFGPYILVSLACAAGNWLGGQGVHALAIGLLVAGAFLLLHLASLPYAENRDDTQPN